MVGALRLPGQRDGNPGANATVYLDVFGRVTVAWIWLRQVLVAQQSPGATRIESEANFYQGKLQAARYCIEWELPAIAHLCGLLSKPNLLPYQMVADAFQEATFERRKPP
jgi:butyryl-CoA dehydrogenase